MSTFAQTVTQVDTPVGRVLLRATGGAGVSATAWDADVRARMPPGMGVERAVRIDLHFSAKDDGAAAEIGFALDAAADGGAEPGERLESILFRSAGARLSLATRDALWMLSLGVDRGYVPERFRAEDEMLAAAGWPICYLPKGITITLPKLRRGETVMCPFALAFDSTPATADHAVSTWFAVDAALP